MLILALSLIVSGYFSRIEGRLGSHENVYRLTDTLTQPITIYTGKHAHYILSLSYERSRFNIDGNVFGIIARNSSRRQQVEALKTGDKITIWFDAEDEPSTHSYLNIIEAVGLSVGEDVIVDPKTVAAKNQSEYYWTIYSGIGLLILTFIIFVYRKLHVGEVVAEETGR